jgi:uncharacterized protein with gpF-like domain
MIPMNKEPGTELNSAFLETKEREDWERLNHKFSNGKQQEKKRDEKVARKTGDDNTSQSSISSSKYSVGSKLPSGAIVK